MKTVIEMARIAGARPHQNKNCDVEYLMDAGALEAFAELVRADERNRVWTQEDWTEYECSIAAAENEACAQIAHEAEPFRSADLIRARMKR